MIFGDIIINIGYKTTLNLGSLEPSYKVHTDWTEQPEAKSLKLDGDDSGCGFKMGIRIWIRSYCRIMLPCNPILAADTGQTGEELSSNKVQSNFKYSSREPKYTSQIPIGHYYKGVPKAPRHCMPGSPWAASSPYHHGSSFSDQKYSHYGIHTPLGNHNAVKNSHSEYRGHNPWTPEPCSINRRQSYVSRRDSQQLHRNEILTDDED
ncbi:hypothetical protein Smp_138480 [Schistosoma mansoni]|uniref:hypothetical protein n=1 Tax=Schistosoma mansoni TaxID=6183 RepID=UPI00022DC2B4|nr:hypothetical protein Smp_138480 [Schistosoma mansoni]|eukprot:XP_018651342.1 hypothetical protein Smp_138480 [Schistosoma mansoni]